MNFLDRFNYNISNPEENLSVETKNELKFFGTFNVILFAFFIIKLIFDLLAISEKQLSIIVTASVTIILLINFLYARKIRKAKFSTNLLIALLAVYSIYLIVSKEVFDMGIVVTAIFPIICISLLKTRLGSIVSLSFLGMATLLFLIPENNFFFLDYTFKFKLLFIFSYFVIFALMYLFESIKTYEYYHVERMLYKEKNENKIKTDFINKLSHQLRTPLNNIMVITNIVTNTNLDEKQKDLVDTIYASTNNLVDVVDSMVNITRGNIEQSELKFNFNLRKTLYNTIKLYSSQNDELKFNFKISDDIPNTFIGDPVKFKQIILNLIESILKNKIREKAEIRISVTNIKEENNKFNLSINIHCDTPLVIPTSSVNQYITNEKSTDEKTPYYIDIFELGISKKLIDLNGGNIRIEINQDSSNFSFNYTLNKAVELFEESSKQNDKHLDATNSTENQEAIYKKNALDLKDANVLLVEDNLINQKIVVLSMKSHVKNIDIANNGKEALDKFGTSKYDIILMDIQMPIMNGITSTKKIREIEKSIGTHTPIIAITANALLGDKEECINAGMDEYISKPFQIEMLIQKMKKLLGQEE